MNAYAASETITDRKITKITLYTEASTISDVLVHFSPAYTNTQNCGGEDYIVRIHIDVAVFDAIYSSLLAASVAGKLVSFGINGCSGDNPLIYRVEIKTP